MLGELIEWSDAKLGSAGLVLGSERLPSPLGRHRAGLALGLILSFKTSTSTTPPTGRARKPDRDATCGRCHDAVTTSVKQPQFSWDML
jgi:hypothetical protein